MQSWQRTLHYRATDVQGNQEDEGVDPRDARVTAAEVEAIRRTLRCRVVAVPYPLMAFGCVDLGGVPVTAAVGRDHMRPTRQPHSRWGSRCRRVRYGAAQRQRGCSCR